MTRTWWLLSSLALFALAFGACQKSEPARGLAREYDGVKVEWPRLETEFTDASPETQMIISTALHAFRYGQFPQALLELNKLAQVPGLTDTQKKLIADLIEQTKQVIAKAPRHGP